MKKTKQNKVSLNLLGKILTIIIIILLALISFVGIWTTDKKAMKNLVPEYKLGMDLSGARNIVIKPSNETETKTYDAEGNLITDDTTDDNVTKIEEPVNAPESLNPENYKAVVKIIEERLKLMQEDNYLIRYDESTGEINLEIPENNSTDYIAQYSVTKGDFKISDDDTSEVLLDNSNIKEAKVQYATSTSGTTVYLSIQFDKEGTKKLKDISNTYVSSEDSEGNTTTKKIKMTLDDETIISTYFQEEITNGSIQLSMGTSTNSSDLQNYLQQASNIAIFLNSKPMPITYQMEVNRLVYSDITFDTVKIIIAVFLVIAIVMAIYMIARYKKNGLMGVIVNIGFVAILLLAIRLANVVVSLSGIFAIAIMTIIEYIILMLILKEYNRENEAETVNKNVKQLLGRMTLVMIPLGVMAVTFAVTNWEEIASVGMVLFWAILIMAIYNIIILAIKLFSIENDKSQTKSKIKEKKQKYNKKVIQILLICLIIAGIIVISTIGFNVGTKYAENTQININLEKEFDINDIKNITSEVLKNKTVLVQKVELYNDMVQITIKGNINEEEVNEITTKINEKYDVENKESNMTVTHNQNVRLRNIIMPYILPVAIVSVITVIYAMILYRKLGVCKVLYETAMSIVAPQAILSSIYAVTRLPINRLTTIIAIIVYIASITLSMVQFNRINYIQEKENKE